MNFLQKREIQTLGWRFSWSFEELVWLDLASSWSVVNVVWLETKQSCFLPLSGLDFVRLRCKASAGRPSGTLERKVYFLVFWFSLRDNNKDLTWCRRLVRGNWWGVGEDKNFKRSNSGWGRGISSWHKETICIRHTGNKRTGQQQNGKNCSKETSMATFQQTYNQHD